MSSGLLPPLPFLQGHLLSAALPVCSLFCPTELPLASHLWFLPWPTVCHPDFPGSSMWSFTWPHPAFSPSLPSWFLAPVPRPAVHSSLAYRGWLYSKRQGCRQAPCLLPERRLLVQVTSWRVFWRVSLSAVWFLLLGMCPSPSLLLLNQKSPDLHFAPYHLSVLANAPLVTSLLHSFTFPVALLTRLHRRAEVPGTGG